MLVGMAMDAHAMTQAFAGGDGIAMLAGIAGWLAAGGLIGVLHFLTLRRSARMLAAGSSLPAALVFHLARFVVTVGALTVIARHGALPLLAATLGLLAARTAVISYGALR
jgi:F1F0 ATPase subunit 2